MGRELKSRGELHTLDFNGKKLYYRIQYDCDESVGWWGWTEFLRPITYPEMKWSWSKFKKISTGRMLDGYDVMFIIDYDIHDAHHTKGDIRQSIKRKMELYNRKEQINNGEII